MEHFICVTIQLFKTMFSIFFTQIQSQQGNLGNSTFRIRLKSRLKTCLSLHDHAPWKSLLCEDLKAKAPSRSHSAMVVTKDTR